MAKRGNKTALTLFLLCAALLAAGFFLMYQRRQDEVPEATPEEKATLYEEVLQVDLVNDYPQTPEGVMDLYDKTVMLLYDPETDDEQTLKIVISRQRALYDQELLALNTAEDQLEALVRHRTVLQEQGVTIKGFKRYYIDYEEDENGDTLCLISAVTLLKGEDDLYFKYHFRQDEGGNWKLYTRQSTNAAFQDVSIE